VEAALLERFETAIDDLGNIDSKELKRLMDIASTLLKQIDRPISVAALMFSIVEVATTENFNAEISGYA